MKAKELREKSIAELNKELSNLMKERFNLRLQKGIGEAPKAHVFQQVKTNIARIKTIIREKEQQA